MFSLDLVLVVLFVFPLITPTQIVLICSICHKLGHFQTIEIYFSQCQRVGHLVRFIV